MKKARFSIKWLVLVIIVLLGGGAYVSIDRALSEAFSHCGKEEEILANLDAGNERIITVYALNDISDVSIEICSAVKPYLLYRVSERGKILASNAWIGEDGGNHQNHHYSLRYAEKDSLVGLVDGLTGPRLVAVYDFKSGDMWPKPILLGMGTSREKWMGLFLRVQQENSDVIIPTR